MIQRPSAPAGATRSRPGGREFFTGMPGARAACLFRWPVFAVLLFLLAACADPAPAYIVEVNHQKLPLKQVVQQFRQTRTVDAKHPVRVQQLREFIEENFLNDLLFQAEAYRLGLDKLPEAQSEIERKRREILIGKNGVLYQTIIPRAIMVEESELRGLYEQQNVEIKIAHILVHSPSLADSLFALLQKGADFAKLAQRFSVDWSTARQGGVIPQFFIRGQKDPLFEKHAFQLEVGAISPPIQTSDGFHLIKLLERHPHPRKPFERVRDTLLAQLQHYKKNLFLENYINELFVEYAVTYNDSLWSLLRNAFVATPDSLFFVADQVAPAVRAAALARFRGGVLTVAEFMHRYHQLPLRQRIPLRRKENMIFAVRRTLAEELLYAKALDLGLDQDPKYYEAITRITDRFVEKLYRQKFVEETVTVTDAEVETYLRDHAEEYRNISRTIAFTAVRNKLAAQKRKEKERELRRQLQQRFIVRYKSRALQQALREINGAAEEPGRPDYSD